MKARHVVNLILAVYTREDVELAKAVRDKYVQENPDDGIGVWQIYECGEVLNKVEWCLDEIEAKGEEIEKKIVDDEKRFREMRELCSSPEERAEHDKWERWFRHWLQRRAAYYALLDERAKAYGGWG